jgi:hypothetical protein
VLLFREGKTQECKVDDFLGNASGECADRSYGGQLISRQEVRLPLPGSMYGGMYLCINAMRVMFELVVSSRRSH